MNESQMNKSNESYPSSDNFGSNNIRLIFALLISIALHGLLWGILKFNRTKDQLEFLSNLPVNKRVRVYVLPVTISKKIKPIKQPKRIKKISRKEKYKSSSDTHSVFNNNKLDSNNKKNNIDGIDEIDDRANYNAVNYSKDYKPPRIISKAKPIYPDYSYRHEQEGRVVLKVQIKSNGTIGSVVIHASSGHPLLDDSAHKSITTSWRFKPAYLKNRPITSWVLLPIKFQLEHN